uniref:Ig-like domain-containing protein n=1 Tax=Anopheles atroparvus TaxID=41427 RepID=A0A182J3T8_ANOAO
MARTPYQANMDFFQCTTLALIFVALLLNGLHATTAAQGDEDDPAEETNSYILDKDLPKFGEPIQNLTVPVGREAVLTCVINNLQTYKVAWLRVDTQTILTIQTHVITKNHRMTIAHVEGRAWVLRIRDVKESDKGWYMCQVNTDPMRNQIGYLNVVVPPNILDYPTSTDMVVREGSNVTLKCAASGSPTPSIMWRRESNEPISAGVPPMIWIQDQLVGAALGQRLTLECQSEAYPRSINYWMKNDTIITQGKHFEPSIKEINSYKVVMKLTIKDIDIGDFGTYKCVVKNSLGETDGSIKVYHIPSTTVLATSPPATTTVATTTETVHRKNYRDHRYRDNAASFNEDQREKEAFVDNEASSRAGQPHRATVAVLLIFICYTLVASSLARR